VESRTRLARQDRPEPDWHICSIRIRYPEVGEALGWAL